MLQKLVSCALNRRAQTIAINQFSFCTSNQRLLLPLRSCGTRLARSMEAFRSSKRRKPLDRHAVLSFAVLAAAVAKSEENRSREDSKNEDIAKLMLKGRRMLQTNCSLEKVEEVYTEALHLALSRKERTTIAYIQDQLANLALRSGQLKKAEELFRNVIINLLDDGKKEEDPAILEISLKLATIYASTGNAEYAASGYSWVIETLRKNLKELKKTQNTEKESTNSEYKNQLALLGMTLDSYGRYLFHQGNSQEALKVTKEAASISVELFGENDMRTLVLYNDISAILNKMNDAEEAIRLLEKTIAKAKEIKGAADHSDLAVFYVNLASVYRNQGETKKAEKAYQQAVLEGKLSNDKDLIEKINNLKPQGPDGAKLQQK